MALTVTTNGSIFCRYERPLALISVQISSPDPLPLVLLVALRRPGFGDVIVEATAGGELVTGAILDLNGADPGLTPGTRAAVHEGINYVRRGDYVVEVRDAETGAWLGACEQPIRIVPLTLEHWRATYLFGIPLHAEGVLAPLAQPRRLTGVTIHYVDTGMLKGRGVLSYTAADRSLSWRGGPAVPLEPSGLQTAHLLTPEEDAYLEAQVDPAGLPTVDTAETLLIDNARMSDSILWHYLDRAYDQIEAALQISLEVRVVATDGIPGHFDEQAPAVAREAQGGAAVALTSRHARPLRKVLDLTGYMGREKVLTVPAEWLVVNHKAAVIDLRPAGGAPMLFSGFLAPIAGSSPAWPTSNITPMRSYPGFWHYKVVAGLDSLDGDRYSIVEAIAKQAALDVLQDLSLAATGGRTSRSAQREGVSESWSYGSQGAYGEKIGALQQWLEKNLPRMRQFFAGFTVEIL